MILRLGGQQPRAVMVKLEVGARALIAREADGGRSAADRKHVAAARPRARDLVRATNALVPKIKSAVDAMRAPFFEHAGLPAVREAAGDAGDDPTSWSTDKLLRAVDQMTADELHSALSEAMAELYRRGLAHAKVELQAPGSWTGRSDRAIKHLDGYALDFATSVSDDEKAALKALIRQQFTDGVSIKQLAAAIAEFMADGVHRIDRTGQLRSVDVDSWSRQVARTEVARAQNGGVLDAYKQLGVAYIRWIAADDERTCPICNGLDGTETALGTTFEGVAVTGPPEHVSCRCTIVAVRNTDGTLVR